MRLIDKISTAIMNQTGACLNDLQADFDRGTMLDVKSIKVQANVFEMKDGDSIKPCVSVRASVKITVSHSEPIQ